MGNVWKWVGVALVTGVLTAVGLAQASSTAEYGPEDFVRRKGEPQTITETFEATTRGPATACLVNGGRNAEYRRVSSATVLLNGRQVFGPADFNQNVAVLRRAVRLVHMNTLKVTVRSAVGSGFTLAIVSGEGATCPGETANRPPVITSMAGTTASVGVPYVYDVDAADPDGDTLTYALTAAPAGMTIDAATGLIAWTPPAPGNHPVRVLVSDGRGGQAAQEFTLLIASSNRPPTITSTAGTTASVGVAYVYDVDATDPDGDTLTYALTVAPAGMTIDTATGLIAWTPPAPGTHPVAVRVTDGRGGQAVQNFTLGVTQPNRPPTIISTAGTTASVGVAYLYDVDATDLDGDTLTYALTAAPAGMTIDTATGLIAWTPPAPGNHPVAVLVSDGRGGQAAQNFTLVATQPNRPPTITSTAGTTASVGVAYAYDVDATDPDGDTLTYALTAAPAGMTIDAATGLIAWTPPAAGSHPVAVLVSDGLGGQAVQNFTLVATQPNRPPTITSTAGTTASVGVAYLYDVDAADPDGDTLTYLLTAAPAGMTIDAATGLIAWTPPAPGTHPVAVLVTDGLGGQDAQNFTLVVTQSNRPPTITTSPVFDARAGQAYVYDVDATDPDGDAVTYALAVAPQGMTINPSTGLVSWTPTAAQVGVRSVRVQVVDALGADANQGWAIQVVAPVNLPPTATDDHYSVGLGQTLTVPAPGVLVNDNDPEGRALTARLMTPPAEGTLAFQPDGGFTYTPRPLVTPGVLDPTIEWQQSIFRVAPSFTQIMMTPVVIDANRDGAPEVFVSTFAGSGWAGTGVLRALAGRPIPVSNFNLVRLKNATIQVSSTYSASLAAERAIDGDLQTSWFTARPDPNAFFQVTFPAATTVREVRMFGSRQAHTGRDFLSGRFELFDDGGAVLFDTGVVALPAPNRDVTIVLPADVPNVRRVRFTATGFESQTLDHGFGELEVIGDAIADAGTELWSVPNEVPGASGIAAGDIDLDGFAEIVAQHRSGGLVAFEHDGTVKWRSASLGIASSVVGGPSLADLDGDGRPEIVFGSAVLNSDGTLRWGPVASDTGDNFSVVADLDLDGRPEIVTGKSAYRADGSVYWTSTRVDGFTAVGNFDADAFPEIVVVSSGAVRLLEHDGVVKWGPVTLPGGGRGGPPTVADVDADGQPEIGVAGATRYVVIETNGSIKWAVVTQDSSSNATGSSVFDFEGDGSAEIVYGDELHLRILRGVDGAELFKMPKGSGTLHEIPVVADVDGDGRAEIVTGANDFVFGNETGLYVIGGANDDWVSTRSIWNQHDYHITNVNDDGTIPAAEPPNWLVPGLNNFRTNGFAPGDRDRTTSFTYRISDGVTESGDATVRIDLRQPNSPPKIQPVPSGGAAVGVSYVYAAVVTDPDVGDTHTFNLVSAPAGMTVDALTGLVRWTPAATQLGLHQVKLRVVDRGGLSDTYTFDVTVGQSISVPNVTGVSQASATQAVQAAGLTLGSVTNSYSLVAPAGQVINQLPVPNTLVAAATPVHLEVSLGLAPVAVPNLVGLTPASATQLLTGNNLVLGRVTFTTSNTAPANTITVQSPAAGTTVGITSAVDITVATGRAIAVSLAPGLIEAGAASTIVIEAYDTNGAPISPLPPVTLTVSAVPGETAGPPPAVVGNTLTTTATTRGTFTLHATLASGDVATATLVVQRSGTGGPALYSTLSDVIGALPGDLGRLETAILASDLPALPALRDALVATRARLQLDRLAGATVFTPEGGFAPTLAQLNAAGFPETPADVAWNTALRNVIATIKSIEDVLAQLSPGGAQNDDLLLQALNAQLASRVTALVAITPTVHGVVKRGNVVNQLVSIRIPRLIDAQVSAITRTLTTMGLARHVDPLGRFYEGVLAAGPAGALDPAAYYAAGQPTFFTLPSLMSATRIQMDLINRLYVPVIKEVIKGSVIVASAGLLRTYANAGSLVSVITASSLSLHFFEVPGSVIEGFGFDRDFPEGNQVLLVGPASIDAFTGLLSQVKDRPDSFSDLEEMNEYFQGVADSAQAFVDVTTPFAPDSVVGGCILDSSSACAELVFDNGFTSVHSTGSFPAPVLLFVRNVHTGSFGILLANFFPK